MRSLELLCLFRFSRYCLDVKLAPDKLAFKFKAVCCAVEIGLFKSLVLLQFPRPTIADVIPDTTPVKVGDARLAFKSNASCVAVEIGLFRSLVLFMFEIADALALKSNAAFIQITCVVYV